MRTPDAIARNVTIHVDVFRTGEARPVRGLTSQWVASIDPQAVSHTGRFAQVDIPANENPARCLLLLQHADTDEDCYLHSFGKLIGQPDGRHHAYRLPPGKYRVVRQPRARIDTATPVQGAHWQARVGRDRKLR